MRKYSISFLFRKTLLSGFIFFLFGNAAISQAITNYTFAASSGTFTTISGATFPTLTAGNADDGYFNGLPIGFDFWYMGVRYTTASVSTNGWITLGSNITNDLTGNDLYSGGAPRPVIAPLWDDIAFTSSSSISYNTTGSVGSRIFTIQFLNARWNYSASSSCISFQLKLYEGTGRVGFIYRTSAEFGTLVSPSASIGITAAGTGSGNFRSLNNSGTAPSVSSFTSTNTISSKPANGQTYNFAPPVPTAPGSLSFSSVTSSGMTLNWTDLSSNERGFVIYRSSDGGVSYNFVSQVGAGVTSSVESGLSVNTTYHWRVYAVTEGGLSTALSGSQSTLCTSPNISQIPTTNLIAYYRFEGNALDATGNNNGNLVNNPTASADRFGNAGKSYTFNGTNQHVTTTNSYSNPTNFTISTWFKTNTTTGGKLMGFGNSQSGTSSSHDRALYMNNAGNLYFGVYYSFATRMISSPLTYNDNNWHLATVTFSSIDGMKLFVDGSQVAANATYTQAENTTGYWRIGYDNLNGWPSTPSSHYFKGTLDDVMIYHTALSSNEVETLYSNPDGASNNGPVCTNSSITLSATTVPGASYSWTGPNGFASSSQNPSFTFTAASAGTYTVVVTQPGCATSATAYTNVVSGPIGATVNASTTPTCIGGSTGTITASASGGTGPYTYSLNGGTYQGSATFTGLAAADYTVNVMTASGCVTTTAVTVNAYATSPDNQNAAGADTWIGHMYDGTNFSNYAGQFTEEETFLEAFGGSTVCFNIVSNSATSSIYTESFSSRLRMNSTKRGLYIADLGSDDGSRLTVDGTLVYNNWSDQAFTTKPRVLMNLTGSSSLVYEFYENGGGNQLVFQNLTLVLANNLTTNVNQNICVGNPGTVISGDTYGTLPSGITLSGTGYQWSYSTTAGGARTNIAGATAATYTPTAASAPFSTPGTYYIYRNAILSSSNNISPNPFVAANESNAAIIIVTSLPAATISYAGTPYCSNSGTATVTRSGTSGGTYSSTAGLAINSTTGSITLASSTAGTYTVTYTMAAVGGCSLQTATTNVTVTAAPSASFSYTGSPYVQNAGTATVSFSGTPGGTFTSTPGLSINSANGAVTLASSTLGTYTVTYTVAATGGCAIYTTTASITIITGVKTFTGTGNFSDAARWTDGVLPVAGENLVIDGTCIVDNNVTTNNVLYGTLTVGTAVSRSLSWAVGGINRLNITNFSSGAAVSSLNMTNGGTLVVRGSITATSLNFTPGTGTVEIQSNITLPPVPVFNNLTINGAGIIVKLGASASLTGNLTITDGNFQANNFNLSVAGNWVNNKSTTAFTGGTTMVTFNGSAAQTISGSFATTFGNLTIANTANTVSLNVNAVIDGNLAVNAGTFNLGGYTANRSAAGGTLTLSNSTTLRIGGTNTFPANFTSNSLAVASTVEYYGNNQAISQQTYGNLSLSGTAGAVVKTFPGTALSIVGNLISSAGSATSVTFTAASNISIAGNVTIGASTTFNGGAFSHLISGNWTNSGTYAGSTGTVTFNGVGKSVSGAGSHQFNNLTVAASSIGFTANSFTLSGSLATTGSGTFSQASGGTITMTGTSKSITGAGISFDNLVISGSISTTSTFSITGNLTVNGTLAASAGTITMSGNSKTISGSGVSSFATLNIAGSVTTGNNFSIQNGLIAGGSFTATGGTATFTGTSTLSGSPNLNSVTVNGTSLQLSTNSVLGIANVLTISSGTLDVTTSIPNTVNFNGTGAQSVNAITYSQLLLSNGNTKTAAGNITTKYDVNIGTGTTFDPGAHTISIYGNWVNSGVFTPATSTVQFVGPATAFVTGATTFNILTSNTSSASTELILNNDISVSTLNMIQGIVTTGTNTITITGTRTGNGYIYGNIRRTHTFTTGVAYAFEGPDNTVNFTSVSGVTSILVSVVRTSAVDFPFGGAISRVYTISIPAGTYTADLRLHYEDGELNGNNESSMALWRYNGSAWGPVGKTASSTTSNYIEYAGLSDIQNRWTCSDNSNVVQWTGTVNTDWNNPGNWSVLQGSASMPPTTTDIVNLGNTVFTNQPTISTSVSVKNIIFGSAKAVTLTLSPGGTLTSGAINGEWSIDRVHTVNVNAQSLTINGDLSLSDGGASRAINLNIGTGAVNVTGSVFATGGSGISFSGVGTLSIAGDFHCTVNGMAPGTGTVVYNGTVNQHLAHITYNNLTINKTAGIARIDSTHNIGGNLLVSAGVLEIEAEINISGNVTINPSSSLLNSSTIRIGGNWLNNGTYIGTGALAVFNGTGAQTISATTFENLLIDKPIGAEATLTGNIVLNGDLEVQSGTLNIGTYSCDRLLPGGSLILADSATIIVSGNNAPVNFTSGLVSDSSTVIANGTIPQLIYGDTYGNLVFRNSGLKTLITPLSVKGKLIIESGATFNGGTDAITLYNHWVNNGTFIPATGSVVFAGTGKTISGVTTFNEVTVTGSYTVLNNLTYNGLLNITGTGTLVADATILNTLHGDLVNSGTLYTLGETIFTGNVKQTLSLINAVQTVAMTVTFNGTVSPELISTSAPLFGFLNVNNTGGVNPSVGWTIAYGMTVGAGASFNGGAQTHSLLGNLNNNGTITSSGTLNFAPTASVVLNLGNNLQSTGTVNFGGSGAISLTGTAGSFHNLNISNINVAGITSSADWSVANDFIINSGSVFNAGSRAYTVGRNLVNNGTINSGTSLFTFNGTGPQELYSGSAFHSLTINKASDSLKLLSAITAGGELKMMAGTADLGGFTLLSTNKGNYTGGKINNGTLNSYGSLSTFAGTHFSAVVNATSDTLNLNGSIFNNTTTLVKDGVASLLSSGGNIFNGITNITSSSSGYFVLGNTAADIFNNTTVFTNSGSNAFYVAFNSAGNQFNGLTTFNNTGTNNSTLLIGFGPLSTSVHNGDVIINNTSGGIFYGAAGGQSTLASGKTISVGATGFDKGSLLFYGFNQLGSTPQSVTLTGTSLLRMGPGAVFNGDINFLSPQVVFEGGAVFNGTTYIAKTGATQNNSLGGNTFNGPTTLANTGSGHFVLGYPTGVDIFNGDLTLTNTGTAGIFPAFNSQGHQFNGNIIFNQTSSPGAIYFCGGTGSAVLAAGKTLSIGATGFTSGALNLMSFTQLGNTAQNLTLTGNAILAIGDTSIFNGSVNFTAPQLLLTGATFNGATTLSKSGGTTNVSAGGNVFNGITTINCAGPGSLDLANTIPDIFNNDATINNTGTGRIQVGVSSTGTQFNGNTIMNFGGSTASLNLVVARNPGSNVTFNGNLTLNCTNLNTSSGIIIGNEGNVFINGNVTVSSTSGRGVLFNDVAGITTLGNGFTITDAGAGTFTTGTLKLARFIQTGATAQQVTLTGTASLQAGPASDFGGNVNFVAPQIFLNGAQYRGSAILRKTGATDNASAGGNIYDGSVTISNNGTGYLRLGNSSADDYNSDATFVQTGSGLLLPGYGSPSTIAGDLSTSGTASPITFGNMVTMDGTGAQAIIGSLSPTFNNLVISNTGNTVSAGVNLNLAGNLSVSSGTFNLGDYTANRVSPGGTLTLSNGTTLRIGGPNSIPDNFTTHAVGTTSTVEFAGAGQVVPVLNSSQHYGHLHITGTGAELQSDIAAVGNVAVTGSFDINANTLKIGGAISNSGVFSVSDGTIELNGSSAQLIPASVFTGNIIKGLTINNTTGVTLGGTLDITDVLTLSGGSLETGDHLTLKSTATGTARVAPVTSLSSTPITGNVTAERYVPGRRKYRLITSPVTTSALGVLTQGQEDLSIWGNWQNLGNTTSPNAGNFITGGTSEDGFDTQTPNASLFTYDDVNRKYTGFTSANGNNTKYTPLKAGIAYYMFVYGDRRNTITTSSPNPTVLFAKGTITTGDQVYNTTSEIPLTGVSGRYTMLGNPFASPIDWTTIPKSDLTNTYWGWDPNLSGTGGYVTVSTVGDVVITSPMSGTTGLNQYIQSGQGFFVKTTGPSPEMTIREQDKVADFNANTFRVEGDPLPLIAVNLQYPSGATKLLTDGAVAIFDNAFSNNISTEDASKMVNTNEGLAISNAGELLSIEGRKIPVNNDTVFLNISKLTRPQYTLQLFTKDMGTLMVTPFLYDAYLNTMQPIQTADTTLVDFTVTPGVPASSDMNRFRIVFRTTPVLPVKFVSVSATEKNEQVEVKWEIAQETGIDHYEVERSGDGIRFSKRGVVVSNGSNNTETYKWIDQTPLAGANYYRIRAIETDNQDILSNTAFVRITIGGPAIKVYPNPVQNKQLHIYLDSDARETFSVMLVDRGGREVLRQVIEHPGGAQHRVIDVNKLSAGLYYLQVIGSREKYVQQIVIE